MARPEGFEPPTLCLEGRRSIRLSYGRYLSNFSHYKRLCYFLLGFTDDLLDWSYRPFGLMVSLMFTSAAVKVCRCMFYSLPRRISLTVDGRMPGRKGIGISTSGNEIVKIGQGAR